MNDSGISVPFTDLPAEKQAELLGWLRQQEEQKRLLDPVHYYVLQYPDGTPAGDTYEMHASKACELNAERIFAYMRSAKARAERWAEWEKRSEAEKKNAESELKGMKQRAADAAVCDLPLPDNAAAWELLEFRRAHPAKVQPIEPRVIPPPQNNFSEADALWVRSAGAGNVLTMPDTLRCAHD